MTRQVKEEELAFSVNRKTKVYNRWTFARRLGNCRKENNPKCRWGKRYIITITKLKSNNWILIFFCYGPLLGWFHFGCSSYSSHRPLKRLLTMTSVLESNVLRCFYFCLVSSKVEVNYWYAKGRVHDVTHCFNLEKKCVPPYLCLPPYIIQWIVVSIHLEEHNRHNRLA